MTNLLHIDAIADATSPVAAEIAGIVRRSWRRDHADGMVIYRDLGAQPVPHLDDVTVSADHVGEGTRTAAQEAAVAVHDQLAAELAHADALLVTVPVFNGMISSTLKAWIDQISLVGRSCAFGADSGPLAGKKITFVVGYGGGHYLPGHVEPYLLAVFGDAFGMKVTVIDADLAQSGPTAEMANLVLVA